MTHWNLSCHLPSTSSNSNFLVTLTTVHKKKRSNETHGTKCYHNYLESMGSMNTTILWYNKTFCIWICFICLNSIKFKFRLERVQGDWSLKKKDVVTNNYILGLGNILCIYILNIVRIKHRFDYVFRMWEHACTIS